MRYAICALVVLACVLPTWASEPGEPLDCSDWVFLEPGYWCAPWASYPCPTEGEGPCSMGPSENRVFDNEGGVYRVESVGAVHPDCPPNSGGITRVQLVRFDGTTDTIIGYIQERCYDGDKRDVVSSDGVGSRRRQLVFDPATGRMLTSLRIDNFPDANYLAGYWVPAIEGFTTTFEILQTYTPATNEISFRVPYMPEGFQYADSFDNYYGDLATVGDWSQAQPLQCDYPTTPPSVGDYIAVNDTLPNPSPGTGRYYVTAVTHQGQTRYGRKNIGGLSGRDPGRLLECSQ